MSVRSYRAAMLSGVAFAVLLFVGATTMFSGTPSVKKSDPPNLVAQKYVTWLDDSGHRTSVLIGGFLVVLAAIALVWFAAALRERYAGRGNPMYGFALLAAAGLAASTAGPLAVVGGHAFGNEPLTNDGHAIWLVVESGFPLLLIMFGLACAAFIATIVVSARGEMPTWLVVFGWVAVIGALLAVEFIPLVLVVLWFIAAGIYGFMRPAAPAAATAVT
jgi:hypothetical protein